MFDLDDIVRRYQAGEPTTKLAREFGVKVSTISRNLRRAGVQIRSLSEACLIRSAGFTPEQRKAQAAAAQAARRGKSNGMIMGERRAQTVERLGKANRDEALLAFWLAKRGYVPMLQKAVGIYNVDLGFEELSIAVEINGTAHLPFYAAGQGNPLVRLEYILDRGWDIFEIVVHPSRYSLREVAADHVIAFLEKIGGRKTLRGQHEVVTGRGEPLPCTSYDANNWPVIERAVRFGEPWRNGKRFSD